MGHGTPDWWGGAPKSTTYALGDMAELAVRLGSIVSFDRRGDVIWLDSFNNGLAGWLSDVAGTGEVYPVAAPVRMSGLAMVLMAKGSALNGAIIYRTVPSPVLGGIGAECSFTVDANLSSVEMSLGVYTGTILYWYQAKYVHAEGKVYVVTYPWTYVAVGTPGVLTAYGNTFHTMKLVANILTEKYVRLLVNGHEYSIGAYAPDYVDDGSVARMDVRIEAVTAVEGATYLVLDDVIVTQNEPG